MITFERNTCEHSSQRHRHPGIPNWVSHRCSVTTSSSRCSALCGHAPGTSISSSARRSVVRDHRSRRPAGGWAQRRRATPTGARSGARRSAPARCARRTDRGARRRRPRCAVGASPLVSRSRGSVLLTTHDLTEAEQLADRVAVVDRGRVVATDTPADLRRTLGTSTMRFDVARRALDGLRRVAADATVTSHPAEHSDTVEIVIVSRDTDEVVRRLVGEHVVFRRLRIEEASLEDAIRTMAR